MEKLLLEIPGEIAEDESEARRIAALYGLAKAGVVGISMRAKREEVLPSLQIELEKLRTQGGFWLAQPLYLQALQAVGEQAEP